MFKTFRIALTAFLVTVGLIKGAPTIAQPIQPQNVSIVHTRDLDLSSEAGRAALDHRLVIAAFEVCGRVADVDLSGRNAVRACRADVLARARADGHQLADRGAQVIVAVR
ncbi:MAG: UrcA family protein [Sphingomicrobium sp.]